MLGVGIIGLGVGMRHLSSLNARKNIAFIGACDFDAEKISAARALSPRAEIFASDVALINDPRVQVVVVCSFDEFHYQQIMAALKAGKHLFVEKPLCLSPHQADEIQSYFSEHPAQKLSCNFIMRKFPRFQALKKLISKENEAPYYVEGDYDYGRLEKITQGWRSRTPDYSVTLGGGIHLMDLIDWLFPGDAVKQVFAVGNRKCAENSDFQGMDFVMASLQYESGKIVKLTSNFGCMTPHFHRFAAYFKNFTLIHDRHGLWVCRSRDFNVPLERIDLPYPGVEKDALFSNFLNHLSLGEELQVTQSEIFDTHRNCFAIDLSLSSGKPVSPSTLC